MKLILIELCFIGFIAAFGKKQEIQVSGKIQCCTELENGQPLCLPPYKSEIVLFKKSNVVPDLRLETIQLGKGDGEYLIEWKGELIRTLDPRVRAHVYCNEDQKQPFEKDYDWSNANTTNIEQDFIINL